MDDTFQVTSFIGRQKELLDLETKTKSIGESANPCPKVVVVQAMGGQGKTQLALKFCHSSRDQFRGIFWINASSQQSTAARFVEIAERLDPRRAFENPETALQFVKNTLARWSERWMLVLDNYDDINSYNVKSFFPTRELQSYLICAWLTQVDGNGVILITSRHEGAGALASDPFISLQSMSDNDGLKLLLSSPEKREMQREDGLKIVNRLGGLALAISQAAAYIKVYQQSLPEFLAEYEIKKREILDYTPDEFWDYQKVLPDSKHAKAAASALTTWDMSFERMKQTRESPDDDEHRFKATSNFLAVCACLESSGISEYIFRRTIEYMDIPPEWSKLFLRYENETDWEADTIKVKSSDQKLPQIGAAEGGTRGEERKETRQSTWEVLQRSWNKIIQHKEIIQSNETTILEAKLPSQMTCWDTKAYLSETTKLRQLTLLHEVSRKVGDAQESEIIISIHPLIRDWLQVRDQSRKNRRKYLEEARDILFAVVLDRNMGLRHKSEVLQHLDSFILNDARILHNNSTLEYGDEFGNLIDVFTDFYEHEGRYKSATKLWEHSLTSREHTLGEKHPATISTMGRLATNFRLGGEYVKCEAMRRRHVSLCTEVHGPKHTETLGSMNNLGVILQTLERYDEAEEIHREILALTMETDGQAHPNTLTSMHNLGSALSGLGKSGDAEQIEREVLELQIETLGPNHLDVSASFHSLGQSLRLSGKADESLQMCKKAVEIQIKQLGRDHPSTLSSMHNLAYVLEENGNHEEAEEMCREVLERRVELLGQDHPGTLISMHNLASVLENQGKNGDSEETYRRVVDLRLQVLGQDHFDTLASMHDLAFVLQRRGKNNEAEEICHSIVKVQSEVLGQNHPLTLKSMHNLAFVLEKQGKDDGAEEIYRSIVELEFEVLGQNSIGRVTSLRLLANLLEKQGENDQAEEIQRTVMKLQVKQLGEDHPAALTGMHNLALVLEAQDKNDEAEQMYRKVVELELKVLGQNNPDRLLTMSYLANILEKKGQEEEAQDLWRRMEELEEEETREETKEDT